MPESQVLAKPPSADLSPSGAPPSANAADPLAWLAPPERYAYDTFLKSRHLPGSKYAPVAASTALGMFELYLNGRSLREIWEKNQHFGFGQVVHAAVEGDWARRRGEHLDALFDNAALRAKQTMAEAAGFTADMMAAAHKLHGDALRKYLQTGNPADLGAMGVGSLAQYQKVVELHMKLTGQDKVQRVTGTMKHEHSHTVRNLPTAPPPPVSGTSTLGFLSAWGAEELAKQQGKDQEE